MIDPTQDLEARLASLRPRALSPDLEGRIAGQVAEPNRVRRGDWFFVSAVASGAMAACVIVGMLITQSLTRSATRLSDLADVGAADPGVRMTALARAGWRWGDDLNLEDDRRLP
jgi:hypothetical protein